MNYLGHTCSVLVRSLAKNYNNCGSHFRKQVFFFRNLASFICSKVRKSYQRKKSCKNQNFHPILTIKYSKPTKMTMGSSNMLSKLIFSHFLKFSIFWYKMLSQKREKSVFIKKLKKGVPIKLWNRPRSVDLFRSVSMIKAIKIPYLEKRRKKHVFG